MEGCRGLHANSWRLWSSSHRAIWKDMTNTRAHTHTHSLFLRLLKHTFTSKHRAPLHHAQVSVIPELPLTLLSHFSCMNMHVWIGALRCWAASLSFYHTHSASQASEPVPPTSSSSSSSGSDGGGDETGECFGQGKEGGRARSRQAEHSVPAGDKGEACQRPHSSELTHTAMHVTHTHTHTYTCTHIVIIYHPLRCLFSIF